MDSLIKNASPGKVFFAILLCVCCMFFVLPAQSQAEEVYEFSFQSMLPESHAAHAVFLKWKDELFEKSNGRLVMNIFTNASVTRYDKAVKGVQGGVVDIATIPLSFDMNSFPHALVTALPFLAKDAVHATKFTNAMWDTSPEMRAEFENMELLTQWCVDRNVLLSVSKDPIKTPADLKNKRVLFNGGMLGDEIRSWGGNPVTVAMTDAYVGLQRGMGDVFYTQINALTPFKLHEVGKSVTILPSTFNALFTVANKDFMADLPPDLAQLIRDTITRDQGLLIAELYKEVAEQDIKMMQDAGVVGYFPTPEEMDLFKQMSMDALLPEWKKIFEAGKMQDIDLWIQKAYATAESIQ